MGCAEGSCGTGALGGSHSTPNLRPATATFHVCRHLYRDVAHKHHVLTCTHVIHSVWGRMKSRQQRQPCQMRCQLPPPAADTAAAKEELLRQQQVRVWILAGMNATASPRTPLHQGRGRWRGWRQPRLRPSACCGAGAGAPPRRSAPPIYYTFKKICCNT